MKSVLNIVFILVFIAIFGYRTFENQKFINQKFTDFKVFGFKDWDSKYISELKNKRILFWATWCTPCHIQIKLLEFISSEEELKNNYIYLSIGDRPKDIRKFLKNQNLTAPIYIDPSRMSYDYIPIKGTPTILEIDGEKIIDFSQGLSFF